MLRLRLRRDSDGRPLLHESGQAVRVEDAGGRASWVSVQDLPEDLTPAERQEVAAVLAGTWQRSTVAPPAERPPVVADQVLSDLAAAGVPVAPQRETPAPPPPARPSTSPATTDPTVLDAKRRQALAAAAREEARAEEQRLRTELLRRRAAEDTDGTPAAEPGNGLRYTPPEQVEELEEARHRRQLAEERRATAVAEAEARQAELAGESLERHVDRQVHGTSGAHLFWVGLGGWLLGYLISVPLSLGLEHAGNPELACVLSTMLQILGIAGTIRARLARVAAERAATTPAPTRRAPARR